MSEILLLLHRIVPGEVIVTPTPNTNPKLIVPGEVIVTPTPNTNAN